MKGSTRGDTGQQSFGSSQFTGRTEGVVVSHGKHFVNDRSVVITRHEVRADTLQTMWSCLTAAEHGRRSRFDSHYTHGRIVT